MNLEYLENDKSIFKLNKLEKQYYKELKSDEIVELAFIDKLLLNNSFVKHLINLKKEKEEKLKTKRFFSNYLTIF